MKTNKFLKIVLGLMVTFAIVSCVQDDDYTVPSSMGNEENALLNNLLATGTEISMAELKQMYLTEPDPADNAAVLIETNIYVKGYVSSSDKTGNFFKEFYVGEERIENGVVTIGGGTETDQYGTTVTSLGTIQTNSHLLRSTTTEEIVPLNVSFSQINGSHVGLFVQVDNVEFADNLMGKRYFDPSQDFDTSRTLQSCEGFSYSTFQL